MDTPISLSYKHEGNMKGGEERAYKGKGVYHICPVWAIVFSLGHYVFFCRLKQYINKDIELLLSE